MARDQDKNRASYSQATTLLPCPQWIKFTKDENRRLHAARRYTGDTVQGFGRRAVMRAVAEVEADLAQAAAPKAGRPAPAGLGIRERREAARTAAYIDEPAGAPSSAPGTGTSIDSVVPRVPATVGPLPTAEEIDALALFVVQGPRAQQRDRLQQACESLARRAPSMPEAVALARRLEAAVAKQKPPTTYETILERIKR